MKSAYQTGLVSSQCGGLLLITLSSGLQQIRPGKSTRLGAAAFSLCREEGQRVEERKESGEGRLGPWARDWPEPQSPESGLGHPAVKGERERSNGHLGAQSYPLRNDTPGFSLPSKSLLRVKCKGYEDNDSILL